MGAQQLADDVVDVSAWSLLGTETEGQTPHDWLGAPDGSAWLFKEIIPEATRRTGEDWAEVIAAAVAGLAGVPTAIARLAVRDSTEGCIVADVKPKGWELQPGAVLLAGQDPDFDGKARRGRGHSLDMIQQALAGVGPPPGWPGPTSFDGFAVFSGYLVLDAVIGNRDRHASNWFVLRPPDATEPDRICPSFDHGSSLGFNLDDDQRSARLDEGISRFARKGTAYRFDHSGPGARAVSLVALAQDALRRTGTAVREYWINQLADVDLAVVGEALQRCSRMSDTARRFALELVQANIRRLVDD